MIKYIFVAVLIVLYAREWSYAQTNRIDSLLKVYAKQSNDTTQLATLIHLINAFMYSDRDRSMAFAREKPAIARDLELQDWESGVSI